MTSAQKALLSVLILLGIGGAFWVSQKPRTTPVSFGATPALTVPQGGTGVNAIQSGYLLFGSTTLRVGTSTSIFWSNTNQSLNLGSSTSNVFTNAPLVVTTNANSFGQLVIQNLSSAGNASSDLSITSDNGTNTSYYVNLGRNSSTNNDANYTLFAADDGYLYDNDNALNIGTASSTNANAVLKFFTGGTLSANERARIDTSGNFGIATTSPGTSNGTTNVLTVGGNVTIGASTAGGTNGTLTYGGVTLANTVTGTLSMVLSQSPVFTGTPQMGGLRGATSATGALAISGTSSAAPTTASATIQLTSGATAPINPKMTFTLQGISIGTTTGATKAGLTIASSSTNTNFSPQLVLGDSANIANVGFFSAVINNMEYIGTSSPTFATTTVPILTLNGNTGAANGGGNVGIGTSSPYQNLSVVGTMALTAPATFATGDSALCWRSTGTITADSGQTACIVSSKYLKHDISNLAIDNSLQRIEALQPVSFAYNDSNKPDLGLIAESVAAVDPRYAEYETRNEILDGHQFNIGDPKGVHWQAITADLVNVVQKQESDIQALKKDTTPNTNVPNEDWLWLAIAILTAWNVYLTLRKHGSA